MGIEVKNVDPVEMFEQAKDMLAANWHESAQISGVSMQFSEQDTRAFYDKMNAAGLLVALGVYGDLEDEGKLIGCSYLTFVPHPLNASFKICNVDNIYIKPEYRGSRAFSELLNLIEQTVQERYAHLLQFHAPVGSPFAKTLASRFEPLSEYFYKEFKYNAVIAPSSQVVIDKVRATEIAARNLPQIPIHTEHLIHAGVYTRNITIPANTLITGALIKCATTLIINGDVLATFGEESVQLTGYNIIAAMPGRKQAYFANTETTLTMIFATKAKTVAEAEEEFTDEAHLLISRVPPNTNQVTITGE